MGLEQSQDQIILSSDYSIRENLLRLHGATMSLQEVGRALKMQPDSIKKAFVRQADRQWVKLLLDAKIQISQSHVIYDTEKVSEILTARLLSERRS